MKQSQRFFLPEPNLCIWKLGIFFGSWESFWKLGIFFGSWESFLEVGNLFGSWESFLEVGNLFGRKQNLRATKQQQVCFSSEVAKGGL